MDGATDSHDTRVGPGESAGHPADDFDTDLKSAKSAEPRTPVRPVSKAISILRYLGDARSSTAAQVARDLSINSSTAFNILRTLVAEGVLDFDANGKTYTRGAGLLALTAGMTSQEQRIQFARERIAAFARTRNATLCLWERVSIDRNVLVATEHGIGNVRIFLEVRDRFPALLGSTGRVLATRMGLSKAEVRRRYAETKWFDKPDFEQFWIEAVEAAEKGFAVDDGRFAAGVLTVAVPITDRLGKIGFTLTALTFREVCRGSELDALVSDLKELAAEVVQVLC